MEALPTRRTFITRTDHQSLKYLLEQRVTTAFQQRGMAKLLGLDYERQYKKEAKNRVTDALSRREEEELSLCAITTTNPTWMEEIAQSYEHDPMALQLLTELITSPVNKPDFSLQQGIIRYKQENLSGREC